MGDLEEFLTSKFKILNEIKYEEKLQPLSNATSDKNNVENFIQGALKFNKKKESRISSITKCRDDSQNIIISKYNLENTDSKLPSISKCSLDEISNFLIEDNNKTENPIKILSKTIERPNSIQSLKENNVDTPTKEGNNLDFSSNIKNSSIDEQNNFCSNIQDSGPELKYDIRSGGEAEDNTNLKNEIASEARVPSIIKDELPDYHESPVNNSESLNKELDEKNESCGNTDQNQESNLENSPAHPSIDDSTENRFYKVKEALLNKHDEVLLKTAYKNIKPLNENEKVSHISSCVNIEELNNIAKTDFRSLRNITSENKISSLNINAIKTFDVFSIRLKNLSKVERETKVSRIAKTEEPSFPINKPLYKNIVSISSQEKLNPISNSLNNDYTKFFSYLNYNFENSNVNFLLSSASNKLDQIKNSLHTMSPKIDKYLEELKSELNLLKSIYEDLLNNNYSEDRKENLRSFYTTVLSVVNNFTSFSQQIVKDVDVNIMEKEALKKVNSLLINMLQKLDIAKIKTNQTIKKIEKKIQFIREERDHFKTKNDKVQSRTQTIRDSEQKFTAMKRKLQESNERNLLQLNRINEQLQLNKKFESAAFSCNFERRDQSVQSIQLLESICKENPLVKSFLEPFTSRLNQSSRMELALKSARNITMTEAEKKAKRKELQIIKEIKSSESANYSEKISEVNNIRKETEEKITLAKNLQRSLPKRSKFNTLKWLLVLLLVVYFLIKFWK